MTKEDILEAVALDIFSLEQILDEFFSQNVCIPKGENRHPYADVLHELVENSLLEYEVSQINFISWDKGCMLHETAYRIKPLEPTYEWQWLDINPINHQAFFINEAKFMTEEDCNTYTCYTTPIKIEETKRVTK